MKGVGSFRLSAAKFYAAWRKGFPVVMRNLFHAVLAAFFATFGITIGVVSGILIGIKTQYGILGGASGGAIFGGVSSTWLFRACIALWGCEDSSSLWILSQIDSMAIMATNLARHWGTRRQEQPATMQRNKDRLPRIDSTDEHWADSCSICLQELEATQVWRKLPQCQHTFHADCVDTWFCYQRSCPLCRRRLTLP